MIKQPTRRSRQEKVERLLQEYHKDASRTAVVPSPTKFETQFYKDLVAYKVPLQTDTPIIRERSYIVGRVYIMYGGTISSAACGKLRETLEAVGLEPNNEGSPKPLNPLCP